MVDAERATLVERDDVAVMFKRVADEQTAISRGWADVEQAVRSLRGRKFYGVFDGARGEYRTTSAGSASRPSSGPRTGDVLGVVLAAEPRRLGPTFVPGFLKDRRDLGVGDEVLPALRIPVEEHPDPVVLIGIAKHGRTLRTVLLPLLSALG